jgi:polar amino acid transport system permease protein/polar amino acid transport system substrate-binding protein
MEQKAAAWKSILWGGAICSTIPPSPSPLRTLKPLDRRIGRELSGTPRWRQWETFFAPERRRFLSTWAISLFLWMCTLVGCTSTRSDDLLARIQASGRLVYGSDYEGGGPYVYPDPQDPQRVTGFEVELIDRLAGELGPRPVLAQGQWDMLLPTLKTGRVDLVLNGYELTEQRTQRYLATRPYYVFQLQLMALRGGTIRSWADVEQPKPGGGRWRIGVLGGSAAETYVRDLAGETAEVVYFTGATDAMMAVKNGQLDATLQDLPAARFYRDHYPTLELVGPPIGHGYYVIYLSKDSTALCDALNRGIARMIASGELRALYERYGIWTDAQTELASWSPDKLSDSMRPEVLHGWRLLARYGPMLLKAAILTIFLSVTSMPLAILLGLIVALGRLYGAAPVRWVLSAYVELLRGTPLMLQLFVLFFLLPEVGIELPALVAAIGGLAVNYSAYEAEIYRAGLQAIPSGQMEAALALGMSRRLALRRIIVPQAVRIVIPPVTNDFIALFKDTSVCSVISLVELTKEYSILANSTGGVLEFAAATAVLYMAMSLPLSWLSRCAEKRMGIEAAKGGALA